jgi:proteasome activator subunit 4
VTYNWQDILPSAALDIDVENIKHDMEELVSVNGHTKHVFEVSRATSPAGTIVMQDGQANDAGTLAKRNRPRTFPYFSTLPYPVEDEATRQENLAEILKRLYIAIQASDFTPGAVHWTRELRSWLSLKFDPTKEQRVKLVQLYYELALAPGIDPVVSERFASMFMLLIKCVDDSTVFVPS